MTDIPGYDDQTGMLFLPDDGLEGINVPDNPTDLDIDLARELILKPIAEFPFVSEDDRATWIGLAFTPVIRQLFPPPYQMGVITATNMGTGKTKLAKLLMNLHGGALRGSIPHDDAELRKSITTSLMDTTAPVVVFDNLTGVIKSPLLDALLTTPTWTDRVLGANRSVTVPNDRLWVATGNNAQFAGDLGRRIAAVCLDPPEANWHERTGFKIKDLDEWMTQHRGEYLAAIVTITRGWINAGRPSAQVRSDDFARWVEGLRGMMKWARFEGSFGGNYNADAIGEEDQEWSDFLAELHRVFNIQSFTSKEIVADMARANEIATGKLHVDRLIYPAT